MKPTPAPAMTDTSASKLLPVLAFVCGGIAVAVGAWGFVTMGDGLTARLVARRVLGLSVLFAVGSAAVGVWAWRRSEQEARRTPEGRAGLLKLKRGDDWFAETVDGKWWRWDNLASDWTPSSPPDGDALTPVASPAQKEAASDEVSETPLPPEAQLVMTAAEAESLRRRKKMSRARLGARTGASFAVVTLVLLVGGVLTLLFFGVVGFLSDLPF